ncbi:MAG: iron-containing alcohol dehydrogenase [Verrucomicrobiae bacterium]|nr:iron-containing alcohol dehydrogenase [Verrucomicrobiae bacterium]
MGNLLQELADRLAFDWQPRTRMIYGPGCVERAGEVVRTLPAARVLLVTDPGVAAAGHADRLQNILRAASVEVVRFDEVRPNPTTRCVEACVERARAGQIDAFVALGGGSAMDTAKGANFILTNGGRMQDYWGVGKATKPMLPLVAIPTTAGTGSEMQCAALIADEQTHQKMACLDPKAAARAALLDPELTLSQPERVTACTGLDAIAHAVESMVTRPRNAISQLYSREAFRLAAQAFPQVLREPRDITARGAMLLAAAFAGTAIENSMLGAAHAAANPLTARFDLTHGHAVALMLPPVVRFNAGEAAVARAYAELARLGGMGDLAEELAVALEQWRRMAGLSPLGQACPEAASQVDLLAAEAARQWTAQFNPRPLTIADFGALYRKALAVGS